ncbi:hypothetical protein LZ32DRAFT_529453, partial [Colletotrichum eremochloae]
RSAVLVGHASAIEEPDERLYVMQLIPEGVVRGRWENTGVPPNRAEMRSTRVLKLKTSTGSAKTREVLPSDEKHDKENGGVVGRV